MKFFCILCGYLLPQEEFTDLDECICRTCSAHQQEALLSPSSENQRCPATACNPHRKETGMFYCLVCGYLFPQEEFTDLDECICRTCSAHPEALLSPSSENQRCPATACNPHRKETGMFYCLVCGYLFPQEEFTDLDECICRTCSAHPEALLSPSSEKRQQCSMLTPDRLLLPPGNEGYPLLLPPGKSEA